MYRKINAYSVRPAFSRPAMIVMITLVFAVNDAKVRKRAKEGVPDKFVAIVCDEVEDLARTLYVQEIATALDEQEIQ